MRLYVLLVLILFVTVLISCGKKHVEPEEAIVPESKVELNIQQGTLQIGKELTLTPVFTPWEIRPSGKYKWGIEDNEIAEIVVNNDFSAKIIAKSAGQTKVFISSHKGDIIVSCEIIVEREPDDGIVKILAIGNSFSDDAIEHYLYGLVDAAGHKVVIGNLYVGGAALALHWQNASSDANAYSYRKISQNGDKTTRANTSISTALADENWDYISFQQGSAYSGQFETFVVPLPALYNYVKERATNSRVKYVLHQTWAYPKTSTLSAFANYGNSQENMYSAIVDAYIQAKNLIGADLIVPAGTAIQNGRTSVVGDNFNRDGNHLDLNIGRYTASCSWFEAIFGESVVGNSYKPSALSDYEAEIAQHAAHFAVNEPNLVTPMVGYQNGGTGVLTSPVFVNFGYDNTSSGWNALTGFTTNTSLPNLIDYEGSYTGISLTLVEGFNSRNLNGPTTTTTNLNMPTLVSSDSYYGNSKTIWQDKVVEKSVVKLEGLDQNKMYNFCFFGSRTNSGTENRETKFIVKGQNETIALLDAANNTSSAACADNVYPNANGEITITITAGENNNNSYGFYYINAMRLMLSSN